MPIRAGLDLGADGELTGDASWERPRARHRAAAGATPGPAVLALVVAERAGNAGCLPPGRADWTRSRTTRVAALIHASGANVSPIGGQGVDKIRCAVSDALTE